MKTILRYLRPQLWRMMWGFTIKFIGTICELFLPWALAYMLDEIVPLGDTGRIFVWGGLMVLCSLLCAISNIKANQNASGVARDTTRKLRHDLYARITRLSSAQIDRVSVPSLVSRLTTDTYNVHQMIGMIQRLGVRAPILLIGGILVTATLDAYLTLVLILVIPLIGISVTFISRKGVPLFGQLQQKIDTLVRVTRENISGARVIKALSKTQAEQARFEKSNNDVSFSDVRANLVMNLSHPVMNLLLNIGLVMVIIAGAYRVNLGLSEPGRIIAFMSYFTLIAGAMMGLTRLFVVFSRASASADRIAEILAMPEDLKTLPAAEEKNGDIHLAFEDVTFSYNKRVPAIEHISFALRHGESLGLIGPTGSCKTTIAALCMRLYDTDEGCIRIDGKDVRTLDKDNLHTRFGVVFQNDVVFSDTVRENIDFGRGLTDEQVETAAQDAQAAEYISRLPEKYAHPLNTQGVNLSGGQRQRLLISRALASSPEFLILDDASSALDYRTDAALRRALARGHAESTTIIIAARVSSIKHCTEILVLDEGRIIGRGTHEQLLSTCKAYQDMYNTQMGGMSDDEGRS